MSKVYSLGITNTTQYASDTESTPGHFDPIKIVASDYAIIEDEAGQTTYTNITSGIDTGEVVTKRTRKVNPKKSKLNVTHPYPTALPYVEISNRLDMCLTETDSSDATYRYDYPIIATLALEVPANAGITDTLSRTIIERLLGTYCEPDATATTKFVPKITSQIKGSTKLS